MSKKKLIYLPDDVAERLDAEPNQSAVVTQALRSHYDTRDVGRRLYANSQKILELIAQKEAPPTGSFQTTPVREDEVDDDMLRKARAEHPKLQIKRGDDWDLVYYERITGTWKELYA